MDVAQLHARLARIYGAHRWIATADVAAGVTSLVELLRQWGVEVLAAVASARGIGDIVEDLPIILTGAQGATIMAGIRAAGDSVANPSQETLDAVDAVDPERTAAVYANTFETTGVVLERRVYGSRRPEWLALEDKMIIDELWDTIGVPRTESAIVDVAEAPAAAAQLAGRLGTVWVADNREGWHGGAEYLRWVRSADDEAAATEWMSAHADRVRVMPFLDGTPCSIHGFASHDGVAAFRPVEMVMLRHRNQPQLMYGGPSTLWDPPPQHREEMRRVASATAAHLHKTVGYLGAFSIDGIMTTDGFRPTELNPRVSSGLGIQAHSSDFPLGSTVRAMIEGDLDVSAQWVESMILPPADRERFTRLHITVPAEPADTSAFLCFEDDAARLCSEDEAHVEAQVGRGPAGGLLRLRFDTSRIAHGPSVAPKVVAALELLNDAWDLGLPELDAAPEVIS